MYIIKANIVFISAGISMFEWFSLIELDGFYDMMYTLEYARVSRDQTRTRKKLDWLKKHW